MKAAVKYAFAATAVAALTACGGGGGGGADDGRSYSNAGITYIVSGGLTWSSPSSTTYIFDSGFNSIELDALGYCSRSTSTNGGPSTPTNFNNQTGWRIPTEDEITAFRATNPNPAGWNLTTVWFEPSPLYQGSLNTYLNLSSGVVTYANTAAKAHVVCVKPVNN